MKRTSLTREETSRTLNLVKFLESQNESLEFLQPVDYEALNLHDYPVIIRKPMDLSTVRDKINNSDYETFEDALNDLLLIWENCRTYNPSNSIIYHQAEAMERHMQRYCSQHGIPLNLPNKRSRDANADAVPYQEKLEFSDLLKALNPGQLLNLVEEIQRDCPGAVQNISVEKLNLKVDAIDETTFYKVKQLASSLLNN